MGEVQTISHRISLSLPKILLQGQEGLVPLAKVGRMARSVPRILIADDDSGILRIVSRVLELNGFNVVTCSTGVAALQIIESTPPVLALLDVRMPQMDGIAVCERVRA